MNEERLTNGLKGVGTPQACDSNCLSIEQLAGLNMQLV